MQEAVFHFPKGVLAVNGVVLLHKNVLYAELAADLVNGREVQGAGAAGANGFVLVVRHVLEMDVIKATRADFSHIVLYLEAALFNPVCIQNEVPGGVVVNERVVKALALVARQGEFKGVVVVAEVKPRILNFFHGRGELLKVCPYLLHIS